MRESPWKGLPPGGSGKLSVLRILESTALEAFWARKPDGRLALLIALRQFDELPVEAPAVRGIDILVLPADRQVQLVLAATGDWEMFHALCLDLLSAAKGATDEPCALQLIFSRLLRWQRLLSRGSGKLLDEREVRGLIGELLFLRDRLLPAAGVAAVECWQGPQGLPQDFVFAGRLIEVKTYAAGASPSVRIASAEQLSSGDVPLFLHLVCLVRQDSALTLPALVDDIRLRLENNQNQAAVFEDKLLIVGYVDLPEYRTMAYAVTSVNDYQVRAGFPRLTVESIPSGVIGVSYLIQLADMRPFAVSADVVVSLIGGKS